VIIPPAFAGQVASLSALECRVLLVLAARASVNALAWPSVARLAADAGLSRRTVHRVLRLLEQRGTLVCTGRKTRGGVKVRRLSWHTTCAKVAGTPLMCAKIRGTQKVLNKTLKGKYKTPIPPCAAVAASSAGADQHADAAALLVESLGNDDLALGDEAWQLARQAVGELPAGDLRQQYSRALALAARRWACLGVTDREMFDRVLADVSNLSGADKAGDVDALVFSVVLAAVREEWAKADASGLGRMEYIFRECVALVAAANDMTLRDYCECADLAAA